MTEILDQSFDNDSDYQLLGYPGYEWVDHPFTPSADGFCTRLSAKLQLYTGSPTGHIECFLYSDNAGVPGSLLATFTTILANSVSGGSYVFYDFTCDISIAYNMTTGVVYHHVTKWTDGNQSASNFFIWSGAGNGVPNTAGHSSNGSSWTYYTANHFNHSFREYYTVGFVPPTPTTNYLKHYRRTRFPGSITGI